MIRVLVLGAYGLIGAGITRHLISQEYEVVGLGREAATAHRLFPDLEWRIVDLRELTDPAAWVPVLDGIDAVVNCAGALQDGAEDDLSAVHHLMPAALGEAAAERKLPVVQISAVGVAPDASTAFFRTKAEGDAALLTSGTPVWILRPGLVISQQAYGGTALIRMLAAVPLVQPLALGKTPVQCVGIADLAHAVDRALKGELPTGTPIDLVEEQPRPLREVIALHRRWLGFAPARLYLPLPRILLPILGWVADGLGRLGWRSPLRSTALEVMKTGVAGDPVPYRRAGGQIASLEQQLTATPVGTEHRLQARLSLLMPLVLMGLSLFWILSGVVGVVSLSMAAEVLVEAGWSLFAAKATVLFWSAIDIAIGLAVLWRAHAARACWAMIVVSLVYLISASALAPSLWLDPLGALVKVIPVILSALLLRMLLENR
ncbi:SDR family oxidoreductase [Aliiroseovarius sp. KMU-50]|uniref:SDR family oxidoreductase n=1 Tax=Aliiroseovarius salicola TaxID=3009082 RepID=A0ABT4VYL6_9RHOB|nr:SDR family oxidoreductase [Aliiroseovarius sp. KMU-50]MDA5093342.1 SDR family oxidoreductase [Aliiroseovarius sp. KMU-50]